MEKIFEKFGVVVVVVVVGNSEVGLVVMVVGEGQQLSLHHFRGFNLRPSTGTNTTFYIIPIQQAVPYSGY